MPDNMTPREFMDDFVIPAIELWKSNQNSKHLSAHAIAQLDILAEVVAHHQGIKSKLYRDDLGNRFPVLAQIRDAHDSHKHGWLQRGSAIFISKGQRVNSETGAGFFLDVTPLDGPLTEFTYLAIRLNDGRPVEVSSLVFDGLRLWEQEFGRLGI